MKDGVRIILGRILKDVKVELGDEFDKNFVREGFFNEAWSRKRSVVNAGKPILVNTGLLRKSVKSRVNGDGIEFYSDLPYAGIHNEGGEIVVTARMKRFFWAKYYGATGSFGRKKSGALRGDRRNARLTGEADFWKAMALMKVGRKIRIPKRQFIGASAEVEASVREIIEENLSEYFGKDFKIIMK